MEEIIGQGEMYTFSKPKPIVGGYRLGKEVEHSIQFNLTWKPKWLHRQMMRIFFGWYWIDEKNLQK